MRKGFYVAAMTALLTGAAMAQGARFQLTAVKAPDLGAGMYKVFIKNLTRTAYDAVSFRCDFFNGDRKVESVNGGLDNLGSSDEPDWVGLLVKTKQPITRSACTLLKATK